MLTESQRYDGRALGNAYETPKHHGAHPEVEVEGGRTYTGSCHCGAVTVAVASKPIDETFAGRVVECNCSFCERVGPLELNCAGDSLSI